MYRKMGNGKRNAKSVNSMKNIDICCCYSLERSNLA